MSHRAQQHGAGRVRSFKRAPRGPATSLDETLFERHLTLDPVIRAAEASSREKFEALAHSVRDALAAQWIKTEKTYDERNVKRVYYLSLEFLIGRTLANNVLNLRLDPIWASYCERCGIDP